MILHVINCIRIIFNIIPHLKAKHQIELQIKDALYVEEYFNKNNEYTLCNMITDQNPFTNDIATKLLMDKITADNLTEALKKLEKIDITKYSISMQKKFLNFKNHLTYLNDKSFRYINDIDDPGKYWSTYDETPGCSFDVVKRRMLKASSAYNTLIRYWYTKIEYLPWWKCLWKNPCTGDIERDKFICDNAIYRLESINFAHR